MKELNSPLNVGFVIEQALGHITHGLNLYEVAHKDASIHGRWIRPRWDNKSLLTALPPYRRNWTIRAGLQTRSGLASAFRYEKPDVLLMDVHLGDQNGLDIVTTIRENKDFSQMNIVMTSGLNVKEECLRRGANHFLLKPFMPDDLLRVLKI